MNRIIPSTCLLIALSSTTVYAEDTAKPTKAQDAAKPMPAEPEPTQASINCQYHIPASTKTVETNVVMLWAQKAAVQSFDFNPASVDKQLEDLKTCYTDQGWQSFYEALMKSGNVHAIKTQHLTVSSQLDGEVKIIPIKDNQWKVIGPLQVVYQNDKEKVTQLLNIELLVGRKKSGDLGIMQLIATPKEPAKE